MHEKIVNLFLYMAGDHLIRELGAVSHERDGSDEVKLAFLQSQVAKDFATAKRYPVPRRYVIVPPAGPPIPGMLGYQSYQQMVAAGNQVEFFDEVLQDQQVSESPLICITPIVDGQPQFDTFESLS